MYMKKIAMLFLPFVLFFASVDFSCISILNRFFDNTQKISVSAVISVQYKIFEQTKQAFSEICGNILEDVNLFLSSSKKQKTHAAFHKVVVNKEYLKYCFSFVAFIEEKIKNITFYGDNIKVPLFFFLFVFIFLLRYLGLLFTFDGITMSTRYKKAYSM